MNKFLCKLQEISYNLFRTSQRNLSNSLGGTDIQNIRKAQSKKIDEKNLANETIVVTNGSTGIGLTLAVKLAKLRANVGIWDKDELALTNTQKFAKSNLDIDLIPFVCDVTDKMQVYETAERTARELGPVTTVISTLTRASEKPFLDIPDDILESIFQSNVLSQLWLTKAFLPSMIKSNNGRLITICSMAGHMGVHKLTDYCATNAAAINFMTALKTELDKEGSSRIKTIVVCPYFARSSNLHKFAKLRLIHAISEDEVAERTVRAIINNETIVFLPGWFKYSTSLRWICPNSVSNFLKNLLIKDSNANSQSKPLIEIETSNYMSADDLKPHRSCDLPETVTAPLIEAHENNKSKQI